MDLAILLLQLVVLAAVTIGGVLLKSFLPTYVGEKGKNLATREDIEEITRKVEAVKSEYSTQLEQLRSELRMTSFQQEIRFARLHEKRAEVLAEMYKRLGTAQQAVFLFAADMSNDDVERAALRANEEYAEYFAQTRLYYPKELGQALAQVGSLLTTTLIDAHNSHVQNDFEGWSGAFRRLRIEVPEVLESIEDQMRSLLGESPLNPALQRAPGRSSGED